MEKESGNNKGKKIEEKGETENQMPQHFRLISFRSAWSELEGLIHPMEGCWIDSKGRNPMNSCYKGRLGCRGIVEFDRS